MRQVRRLWYCGIWRPSGWCDDYDELQDGAGPSRESGSQGLPEIEGTFVVPYNMFRRLRQDNIRHALGLGEPHTYGEPNVCTSDMGVLCVRLLLAEQQAHKAYC